jgi:hypothetical protein
MRGWPAGFCGLVPDTMAMIAPGFPGASFVCNLPVFGLVVVYRHSTESLILAQDERWRRA